MNASISFRPLEAADLPLLHHWLVTPHVEEWWDNPGPALQDVEREYIPRIEGREPTRCYLMLYKDEPIGYIQMYLVDDDPEFAQALQVDAGAAGVDLFIGEDAYLHRGLGAPILRAFLREVVFADPAVNTCVIDPAISNSIAIRAYEKAGFVWLKTLQVPGEKDLTYLMRLERDTFETEQSSELDCSDYRIG